MGARNTYVRPVTGWWRRNPYFTWYMVREGTSIFLATYAVIVLVGLVSLHAGEAAYRQWLAFLAHPVVIALHVPILAAACYHTYSWYKVSPKAMPSVFIGTERVPDSAIIGSQYVTFVAFTLVVLYLAWRT